MEALHIRSAIAVNDSMDSRFIGHVDSAMALHMEGSVADRADVGHDSDDVTIVEETLPSTAIGNAILIRSSGKLDGELGHTEVSKEKKA